MHERMGEGKRRKGAVYKEIEKVGVKMEVEQDSTMRRMEEDGSWTRRDQEMRGEEIRVSLRESRGGGDIRECEGAD